jgi:glycosyltransferase involved in cell wall biosynthesis
MKILHYANMNVRSGVAAVLMNYYRHINRERAEFDFLSGFLAEDNYKPEIERLGGKLFHAPGYKKNIFKHIAYIDSVLKSGGYDAIHCHQFLPSIIPLALAKKRRIPVRIMHSHNSSIQAKAKKALVLFCRKVLAFYATSFFAASDEAALFLFGPRKKYVLIHNAIDLKKYSFNPDARMRIRNTLSIAGDTLVIGYIARFVKEKNHLFLLEIGKALEKKNRNVCLLLIGDGNMRETVKEYSKKLEIYEKVIFLTTTDKAHEYYSAMDIFVFPSRFEGLPVVGIEAQCAGLPVIASAAIPPAMQVTDRVTWLDLHDGAEAWAEKILTYSMPQERMDMTGEITGHGYNIKTESEKLEEIYYTLINAGKP